MGNIMHIKVVNNIPEKYSVHQLLQDNPNTSFPASLSETTLNTWGVYSVVEATAPEVDYTKNLVESIIFKGGKWAQIWSVANASAEETAERTSNKATEVRAERNLRLSSCDWTQTKDIPENVSSIWAMYRESLRNLPTQLGFPWAVIWPETP